MMRSKKSVQVAQPDEQPIPILEYNWSVYIWWKEFLIRKRGHRDNGIILYQESKK